MTSLFFALSLLLGNPLIAQQNGAATPKFEDYAVKEQYKGKVAQPVLRTKSDREFRTRLREGAKEKVNFAGHYVLITWGCGGGCVMGAALDAKTGTVSWIPFTLCCWPLEVEDPLNFRVDSKLIVFTGSRGEQGQGVYYYRFEGGKFVLLKAIEKPQ